MDEIMDQDALALKQRPEQMGHASGPASEECLPPSFVADHELIRRIGRGSYGEVWLARNMMGMYRAVKIVWRKSFRDERPFEREVSGIRQFEPISRSHEGFVDVLQVGINKEQGCFYYVMELGDDQTTQQNINPEHYCPKTLATEISRRGKLSFQECLQLGLALSRALAELHRHGLVHRDVKPSNIIFVNGVAKLADIGLVTKANEACSYVGTEGFIPLEGPGTPQADVYSLGKVLYEASSGKDRQSFPELPTEWDNCSEQNCWLELNEIILQACRDHASKRYKSAVEMHADLVLLENGKSVRRLKLLERRFAGLKRITGVALLALLVLGIVGFQVYREWRTRLNWRNQQVGANVAYGNLAMEAGDFSGALPYFAEALRLDERNANREAEHRLRLGSLHAQCPKLVQMWSGLGDLYGGDFSPDGQRVLGIERHGKAQVFDLASGKPVSPRFGQTGTLWRGAFSPDGRLVVTASEDNTACVWGVNDGGKVLSLPHPDAVLSASFSPNGLRIITSCIDKVARIWNASTGQLELSLQEHTQPLCFAAFSTDGRHIVTTARDNTARVWDALDGQRIGPPLQHPSWVGHASFSPDGRFLVTACFDHKARVWNVRTGQQLLPELDHDDGVNSAEFSPDGRMIVTACLDHTVRLWRTDNHQPLWPNPILRHSDRVTCATFSADGNRILTTCIDGTLRVWDLAGGMVAPVPTRKQLSENKTRFVTVTNNCIEVWNTISGQPVSPIIKPAFTVQQARLNHDGSFVFAIGASEAEPQGPVSLAEVWDAQTAKQAGPQLRLTNGVANATLSNDGKRLLVVDGKSAHIWDIASGVPLGQISSEHGEIQSAVFNQRGTAVAISSSNVVTICDSERGKELFPALVHNFPVSYVGFSSDGSRLVTCGADQDFTKCWAQVWDAGNGKPTGSKLNHADGVLFATFSPKGNSIATAGEDFSAFVWDAATGKQLTRALKHHDQVMTVDFSPNGKWVLTASSDKTARVWSADTGEPLTPLLQHLGRLSDGRFLPDGHTIVTCGWQGNAWVWVLPVDQRPTGDFVRLARLLCGDTVTPSGELYSARFRPLAALWRTLRTKYPADFTTSAQEVADWHEFQARESELREQWFAAAFHLQRLLAVRKDEILLQRLRRAKAHFDKEIEAQEQPLSARF